jgi:hypothetical protein
VKVLVLFAVVAAVASPAMAAEGDDDLALVKRAVTAVEHSVHAQAAEETRETRAARPGPAAPSWLKVRIVDEDDEGASLSLNVPLALVHALDALTCDDEDGEERELGLSDLLAGLRSGQPLVSIEGDDAEVRVWVE